MLLFYVRLGLLQESDDIGGERGVWKNGQVPSPGLEQVYWGSNIPMKVTALSRGLLPSVSVPPRLSSSAHMLTARRARTVTQTSS